MCIRDRCTTAITRTSARTRKACFGRSPRTRSTYRSARYDATRGFFSRVPTHSTTRDVGRHEGDAGRDRDEPARVSRSSRHARERRSAPASTARPPGPPGSRRALASIPRGCEENNVRFSLLEKKIFTKKKTKRADTSLMRTSHRMYTTHTIAGYSGQRHVSVRAALRDVVADETADGASVDAVVDARRDAPKRRDLSRL